MNDKIDAFFKIINESSLDEIDYDYNMGEDPFNGYDEFIFHLYGDFWGTDINNPMVVINMPKSFDKRPKKTFRSDSY